MYHMASHMSHLRATFLIANEKPCSLHRKKFNNDRKLELMMKRFKWVVIKTIVISRKSKKTVCMPLLVTKSGSTSEASTDSHKNVANVTDNDSVYNINSNGIPSRSLPKRVGSTSIYCNWEKIRCFDSSHH